MLRNNTDIFDHETFRSLVSKTIFSFYKIFLFSLQSNVHAIRSSRIPQMFRSAEVNNSVVILRVQDRTTNLIARSMT